jgi:acyl-coenzyme A synthetase/AMP-(fatty) acid ligase
MREDGWIWTGDRFARDADGVHSSRSVDDLEMPAPAAIRGLEGYLDDLPKTGTGKIDRQALRKRAT